MPYQQNTFYKYLFNIPYSEISQQLFELVKIVNN